MPTKLAMELTRHVGSRKIIIHRYRTIEYQKLYEGAIKLIKYIKKFEESLTEFVRKESYPD
jgi:uncharacterized protein YutE (UPF0331/DUF86 family)